MAPVLKKIAPKKMVGKRLMTTMLNDRTPELWRSFMPERGALTDLTSLDLFSIQVFDYNSFKNFNGNTEFEKWAAMEVDTFDNVSDTMERFVLPGGLYAVFIHKGNQQDFNYIYRDWLPSSIYTLDDRPHFAVMGNKYRNNDPESEEEIWIPVKPKENNIDVTYDWATDPNK